MATSIQLQVRRDTAANWASSNPVLLSGEIGWDITNKLIKTGDGSTAWNNLPAAFVTAAMVADFTTMSAIASPSTGGTATLTRTRTGADPVLTSGRYISNDTASGTSASHWTKALPDGSRIIWARAKFEMVGGSTTGQVFTIVLWESNMPAGLLGALVNRGPAHVLFYPNGWLVQTVDTLDAGSVTTIGIAHTYSTLPGAAVQTVTVELDVAAQMCYVTGADGVRVGIGPDSRFATVPAYFADAEILYSAANTDARIKVLEFDADSAVGGRIVGSNGVPYAPPGPVLLHGYYANAWATGQMGTPGYIDRARTFTKIRYVPSAAATGTFTAELRNANDGSTYAGTSTTSAASAKYKEISGTFNFASRDMPYVQVTAISGTVGIGCDVWLIP